MGCLWQSNTAAQLIFHSWFGTYKEDFGMLSQITQEKRWITRRVIGDKLQKPNQTKHVVPVNLIRMSHYAKLSGASQTGLLSQTNVQTASIPVFSGRRVRLFTQEFIESVEKGVGRDPLQYSIKGVLTFLSTIQKDLIRELQNTGIIQTGWYNTMVLNERTNNDNS